MNACTNTRSYTRMTALVVALLAASTVHAEPDTAMPAWQAPGYIMEEVVVTASRPQAAALPAWQTAGYVMEEVVVTARRPGDSTPLAWQAADFVMEEVVVTARRPSGDEISHRMHLLLALHERHGRRPAAPDDALTPGSAAVGLAL